VRSWCSIHSYMDDVASRRFVGAVTMPTARTSVTEEHCFRVQRIFLSLFLYVLLA